MISYTRELDPNRPVTFVTNQRPDNDRVVSNHCFYVLNNLNGPALFSFTLPLQMVFLYFTHKSCILTLGLYFEEYCSF